MKIKDLNITKIEVYKKELANEDKKITGESIAIITDEQFTVDNDHGLAIYYDDGNVDIFNDERAKDCK